MSETISCGVSHSKIGSERVSCPFASVELHSELQYSNEPTWRCQMYIEARGMEIHDGFRAMKRKPSRSPTSSIRQLNLKPDGHASIFKKQRTDGPSPSLRTPDLTWSRGTPVSDAMWSSDNKEEGMNCLEGAMGPLREHVSLDKGALSRVHRMQSFSSNTRLGGVHIQSNRFVFTKCVCFHC